MRDRVGTFLLLAAVSLAGASPALAQQKALGELTTKDVQTRVRLFLEDRGRGVELADVVIDVENIRLKKGAENVYTLEWIYFPAFSELSPAARQAVERKLQVILEEVLAKYRGGLLARQKQDQLTLRFVHQAAQSRLVPLAQLTSAMVRGQVDRFLTEQPALVRTLRSRVVLDVANLFYHKPSEGLALVWRAPRHNLPNDEESAVRKDLLKVLVVALGNYQGGLISLQDLERLAPHISIQFMDHAASAPATPRTGYYAVWRPICGCGGSCWIVEWHPYSVAPVPGAAPEMLGAPRIAALFVPPGGYAYPAAVTQAEPIVVERAPVLHPAEAPRSWVANALGMNPATTAAATTAAPTARPWELALLRDDQLVDDYPKDALICFAQGRAAYLRRDYGEARAYLTHAVKLNDQDARFWYFKALAELAMGRRDLANVSAQHGKDLAVRSLPAAEQIRLSLLGVPAADSQFLASRALPGLDGTRIEEVARPGREAGTLDTQALPVVGGTVAR
jgi:hypothetical protein